MAQPMETAGLCPQCGASLAGGGTRCNSCGFLLSAAPPPRSSPLTARPPRASLSPKATNETRTMAIVLIAGGVVTLALIAAGIVMWPREQGVGPARVAAQPSVAPTASAAPRLDPVRLLAESKRQALEWHRDAVLLSITAGPLDARGVAEGGRVELLYAKPTAQRLSGGAEANGDRLLLTSSGGPLEKSEERAGRGRVTPEPNCVFEDAWAAAQRAGTAATGNTSLRYSWNDKQARPVWEVLDEGGNVQRRLDGVSCSILVR